MKYQRSLLLLALIAVAFCAECEVEKTISDKIYENFQGSTKTMFKVWHYIHDKAYDYNTEEGINKYKTFKINLQKVNDHNKSGTSSYQKGLNHLSDMTWEEVQTYYNIVNIDGKTKWNLERNRSLRAFNLDDFNDEDDSMTPEPWVDAEPFHIGAAKATYANIDHTKFMTPIRDQKGCGSCWAFTSQSAIEAAYQMRVGQLQDYFSVQVMVDCVVEYGGCQGGLYKHAFDYFTKHTMVMERDYPYTARFTNHRACRMAQFENRTRVKFAPGRSYYEFSNTARGASFKGYYDLLAYGPMAVAMFSTDNFVQYKSGLFEGKDCVGRNPNDVNHALTLFGYMSGGQSQCGDNSSYFLLRNSWGTGWGDRGNVKIKMDNSRMCNIGMMGFIAGEFAK
jgi:C1A family cysteine protease